ncbi:head maturation protease, ClpP-related [Paraclostridium sordellii]|uniref:head maturation protease, ClpP-related n=1 Tax=Paraclostridium sordellii TaxID=1505 RepID=UPI0005E553DE|nr:head maturation protease, ClpP-related [Paeniclostridium sordellii]CEN26180.1 putative endopeptidase [[Clostridium] sordellii] [Paeniclostridium sordellii]CEN80933.1 putative endopeptidase [[Clostridium] sordellii] [Paeniclostridium sordellii]
MAKVNIKGPIISSDEKWIYDWFGIEATCAKDIEKAIDNANGEELEVIINSPGGYVDEGSEIYSLLKDYKGSTTGKIVGMAASAASVAAMGVDVLKISPTGRFMIHNASGVIQGDHRAMEHGSEILKECNKAISNAYVLKTGLSEEKLLDLMNKETFMNAQKAKELGFVDEIMFDTSNRLFNNTNESGMLPPDVIEKIRNMKDEIKLNPKKNTNTVDENSKEKEINKLKEKLAFKNKYVSSFLLCQKERVL